MTEPIRSAGSTPAPNVIELEPILISARPSESESVPIPIGKIALECGSELGGVAIAALATRASLLVAGLTAFKAGWDLGECVTETIEENRKEVAVRRALERCAETGGTPVEQIGGGFECSFPEEVY